jgi:hypothetical protein
MTLLNCFGFKINSLPHPRKCPRSFTDRIAINPSEGQMEMVEILAGDTSKLKITLGSALIAAARAVFIIPLWVTTQTFLLEYSAEISWSPWTALAIAES